MTDDGRNEFRYCVLYVHGTEQYKLKNVIDKNLPKDQGEAFVPCMEYYKRGEKQIKERSIFPGYLFLYTKLNLKGIHEMLRKCRIDLLSSPRELSLRERGMGDPEFHYREIDDDKLYELADLDEEESEFLDTLRLGNGLLTMSCGYQEERAFHVMEGPLIAFEDKIQKVDKHNKKAFLKFRFNGRQAQAGFECKPKAHWYPKEESKLATLSDGVEIDLAELRNIMTKSERK